MDFRRKMMKLRWKFRRLSKVLNFEIPTDSVISSEADGICPSQKLPTKCVNPMETLPNELQFDILLQSEILLENSRSNGTICFFDRKFC